MVAEHDRQLQVAGNGHSIPATQLRQAMQESASLRDSLLKFVQAGAGALRAFWSDSPKASEGRLSLCGDNFAQPPGKRASATSLTSLRNMASPKVLKLSICTTNAPGPPITFSR